MSFLDDVFRYEEEEPSSHRPSGRSGFRWLVRPVVISLIIAAGGGFVMRVTGVAVPYPLIFMVVLVIQLLRRTLTWIGPGRIPKRLLRGSEASSGSNGGEDGLRLAAGRWENRLFWVKLQRDPAQFAKTMQPRMVQLIDERLRLRHGVVRANDPVRARAVLGEPLWRFVTAPVRENLAPRDLAALISQVEAL
ncbi:hypothetical protein [Rugosimonospora africana]|uniref:Uncharacterized protein n=1 Tax=Rugosimonospora africana TaxID=556532 RepID=A0A8J3QMB3_9ACTN|nr:hypothetical protein [Rugosimonospora africana]GIH12098.1 hypothetical protein Raf01_02700 [Rugosimonospora africana]